MVRVAVTLPDDIFQAAETLRLKNATKLTRSEFYRLVLEEYVRKEERIRLEKQYIKGYLDQPETPEEVEWLLQASLQALTENPWEKDIEA